MNIKRYAESCMEGGGVAPSASGAYVEYADHIASHDYDEAKERELFDRFLADGNSCGCNHSMWAAWQACAKSRAGIAS